MMRTRSFVVCHERGTEGISDTIAFCIYVTEKFQECSKRQQQIRSMLCTQRGNWEWERHSWEWSARLGRQVVASSRMSGSHVRRRSFSSSSCWLALDLWTIFITEDPRRKRSIQLVFWSLHLFLSTRGGTVFPFVRACGPGLRMREGGATPGGEAFYRSAGSDLLVVSVCVPHKTVFRNGTHGHSWALTRHFLCALCETRLIPWLPSLFLMMSWICNGICTVFFLSNFEIILM